MLVTVGWNMMVVGAVALVGLGVLLVRAQRATNRETVVEQRRADTAPTPTPTPMDFGGAPPRHRARHGQPAAASWHQSAPRTPQ
jgi:hypothetical protein